MNANRPVHEVLEFAWPHLTGYEYDAKRCTYICLALKNANECGEISNQEYVAAIAAVRAGLIALYSKSQNGYLINVAKAAGLLPHSMWASDKQYIGFRNQWLRQLIETERAKHEKAN